MIIELNNNLFISFVDRNTLKLIQYRRLLKMKRKKDENSEEKLRSVCIKINVNLSDFEYFE